MLPRALNQFLTESTPFIPSAFFGCTLYLYEVFLFVFSNIIVNVLRERGVCLRDEGDASVPTLPLIHPRPYGRVGGGEGGSRSYGGGI
jgi:hypothetical protein